MAAAAGRSRGTGEQDGAHRLGGDAAPGVAALRPHARSSMPTQCASSPHGSRDARYATIALIGTLRRECLDHVLIYGEQHLRRILTLYSLYYNETRTHLGLGKDAPLGRHIERSGTIVTTPILSGLHHCYARI